MRLAIAVLILFAVFSTCAAAPAIDKLLPAKGEVSGFVILAGSLTYGKGDDLTKIYNGGYELYTKNGVIDASRQMYQRDKDFVEVTVHTMKSAKAATDFVKYWAKERGGKLNTSAKTGTGFKVPEPNTMAYYAMGRYFVTVSAFHAPDKATKDVDAFIVAIKKRAK